MAPSEESKYNKLCRYNLHIKLVLFYVGHTVGRQTVKHVVNHLRRNHGREINATVEACFVPPNEGNGNCVSENSTKKPKKIWPAVSVKTNKKSKWLENSQLLRKT